ncbi:MAG TPA: succinate dehydrogenase, hydrophobic membrane anchor protein [Rhizomicrobium sp.]|nr:succinate dehydrogenase, hydrophobic membrane anchor protein [Rhizomicrobium sp.]
MTGYRTPRAKVEGLGAAHSGTAHFWQQRVTAIALIPLAIWFGWAAMHLVGAPYDMATAFLRRPVNAVLMILFIFAALYHMTLGVQVVIEDYIEQEGGKLLLLMLNRFFAWIVGAACLFAMFKIAL